MHSSISPTSSLEARHSVTREDLLALANSYDENACAVSFYFSLSSSADNSHRQEALLIKQLVSDIFRKPGTEDGVSKDLAAIITAAEEIRHTPSQFKAVFACRDQHIWQAFDLPAYAPISRLEIGHHFHIAPLLQASESSSPYCAVIVERGKARGFVIRGANIHEIHGRFKTEDLGLHGDDSRVGWSHHIENNLQEHARAYLKKFAQEVHRFMEEHKATRLVIGCREDLWSELEPQLLGPEQAAMIGRFHPPNFDVSPHEVLQAVTPIFQESLLKRYQGLLNKIQESVSHGAVGLDQVLDHLEEGRVHTLLLGTQSNEMITECRQCGHLHSGTGEKCLFCGSNNTHAVLAEEALIRKALLTEAEILLPPPGASQVFDNVAARLRY